MTRLLSAAMPAPLWSNLETAARYTLRALSVAPAEASAFAALEGEQARLRQSSRHWLVG